MFHQVRSGPRRTIARPRVVGHARGLTARVVASVERCKANQALTTLDLDGNKVGDAGATALADALQATVLTCDQLLFRAWFTGCCRCRFTKWCERLACCCFCVYSCFLEENVACRGVLPASCSQVDVARCATTARYQDRGRALVIPTGDVG